MPLKYTVELTESQRRDLRALTTFGTATPRTVRRAHSLLWSAEGCSDATIAQRVACRPSTVARTRRRWVEAGMDALYDRPRTGRPRRLNGRQEAHLIALACSEPPAERGSWTLRLLADRMVSLGWVSTLSASTVQRVLKQHRLTPHRRRQWCVSQLDSRFLAQMEHLLDLYERPYLAHEPVICLDETPVVLRADAHAPLPARPGRTARHDYEYERRGGLTLFAAVEPRAGYRVLRVRARRTKQDFACVVRELLEQHYPHARQLHLVVDNLNTHHLGALYETFPAAVACQLRRRLTLHFTPTHASWLNMAEIELSAVARRVLHTRIPDQATLERRIARCEHERNARHAKIEWRFTTADAQDKFQRFYLS